MPEPTPSADADDHPAHDRLQHAHLPMPITRRTWALALLAVHLPLVTVLVLVETGSLWAISLLVVQAGVLVLGVPELRSARTAEARAQASLTSGQLDLRSRLAEADRMRADLIGTVSHEFRTPLTGIRGAALTLLKRGDRLDKDRRDQLLQAVLEQQERLSRLLENMLTASQATNTDPTATAEVDAVAAEVVMLAAPGRPVSVMIAPATVALIDRPALHQVLANLVDNALLHGAPGAVPLIAGGQDARGVWLTVSNEGQVIDLTDAGRLFEPFTQVESGATRNREGAGVGLYVVRRLVEVYGGSVDVRSDSGWVTVEVRLRAGVLQPTRTDPVRAV